MPVRRLDGLASVLRLAGWSCSVLLVGCIATSVGDEGDPDTEASTVMSSLATYRGRFVAIDRAPYASAIGSFAIVDYVDPAAAPAFRAIHPESAAPNAPLPVGTIIVREVLAADGKTVAKLTLMAKGPTGYDPTLGDWWFGVTDATGAPLPDPSTGQPQVGRLTACHGCHAPRAAQDFLFGVPADVP